MNVLHVTPHLGGGVGKAHAAITRALPQGFDQTFILLEAPRDRSHTDTIAATGARVVVADGLGHVARMARNADIVQFEFWNHPRLFECLARCDFPATRSVFWSHISGLFKPVIQPGLMQAAGRFVMTTEASWAMPGLAALHRAAPEKFAVINSGFGFADAPPRARSAANEPTVAYLGTADFVKMHPGFFDAIDRLAGEDVLVSVWGEPAGEVVERARGMKHPERIRFRGQTAEPARALAEAGIFFYPLQPDHYGTAENALIEAMSLGLAPVVLGNPAELAIVRDGQTGLVARSIDECPALLQTLLASAELRTKIGRDAASDVAQTRTATRSARQFVELWQGLLAEPARPCKFRSTIGDTPADWFLATQCLPETAWRWPEAKRGPQAAKGTLAHFEASFAGDPSFKKLRQ